MTQLFKEVTSPKTSDRTETEELKDGTAEQAVKASESTDKETVKKGKHGDPGVCCGGCS